MLEQSVATFKSFFIYPGLSVNYILIGVLLGIVFGAIWLCAHWPPLFKNTWFWAVAVVSAFLTVAAICFIQQPVQTWLGNVISNSFNQVTIITWLLLLGIPQILVSGLVQEGTKMVPIAVWWWRSGKNITPGLGLAIGAIAGAGFGIFEAIWVHNQMFAAGWTAAAIQTDGFIGIAGFWERFFAIGFHVAVSSLAGYGLAKGKGWQFYLIAAGLHSLFNYGVVVRQYIYLRYGFDSLVQIELFIAVMAVAVTVWALLLRWGRTEKAEMEPVTETAAGEPPQSEMPQPEPRD
jgi:RsiW-degrading membrane proteinase PrsW (M82 family)